MKPIVGLLFAVLLLAVAADITYGWFRCRDRRGRFGLDYVVPLCMYPSVLTGPTPPPQRVGFLPWP